MNDWLSSPWLWMAVVLLGIVGIVMASMWVNVRWERRLAARFPTEAMEQILKQGFAPEDLLLGVPQSAWWKAQLLLHDSTGRPLGAADYGWRNQISLKLGELTYAVRELRAGFSGLAESELVLNGQTLASGRRGSLITEPSHFDVPEIGALTIAADLKSAFKHQFVVQREGHAAGLVLDTGRIGSGWRVLALKGAFSLPVRAYILALENRRMT